MSENRLRSMFFKEMDIDYTPGNYNRLFSKETIFSYAEYLIAKKEPFSIAISIADDFSTLAKEYGNNACDNLLKNCVDSMLKSIDDAGIMGKYGDDRFIILLDGINEYNDVWRVFHNINTGLSTIFIQDLNKPISLTSGISRFPIDGKKIDDLLKTTAKALTRGKEKGKMCFIIYLEAKHADIVVQETKVTDFSSVEIISEIFNVANNKNNITELCEEIVKTLGGYLNPDHLCIQTNEQIVAKFIGSNTGNNTIIPFMPIDIIKNRFDNKGLFFINNRKASFMPNDNSLYNFFVGEGINSSLIVDIASNDKRFGILRVEMVGNSHTWDSKDRVLYTTAAKLLATVLYLQGKEIK